MPFVLLHQMVRFTKAAPACSDTGEGYIWLWRVSRNMSFLIIQDAPLFFRRKHCWNPIIFSSSAWKKKSKRNQSGQSRFSHLWVGHSYLHDIIMRLVTSVCGGLARRSLSNILDRTENILRLPAPNDSQQAWKWKDTCTQHETRQVATLALHVNVQFAIWK